MRDQAAHIAQRRRRLARIEAHLACPECRGSLDVGEESVRCRTGGHTFPRRDGRIYFVAIPPRTDDLDDIKSWLKRALGGLYYTVGVDLVAPTFPIRFARVVRRYVRPEDALVVDMGSGNRRLDAAIVTVDLFDYDEVDLVCDLRRLPFRDGAVDAFVSRSVLEHVAELPLVTEELRRCTRAGGLGIHLIPFLFPFHASPDDFQRLTHEGARRLFPGWRVDAQWNASGPVTLFLLVALEVVSTVLGFGRPRLKSIAYLLGCLVTFPIKFLDWPFVARRAFLPVAPSICTVYRRPETVGAT